MWLHQLCPRFKTEYVLIYNLTGNTVPRMTKELNIWDSVTPTRCTGDADIDNMENNDDYQSEHDADIYQCQSQLPSSSLYIYLL